MKPISIGLNKVIFDNGTKVDIHGVVTDWARWQQQLYGNDCMAPDCDADATIDVTVWGHHVGRVCSRHSLHKTIQPTERD